MNNKSALLQLFVGSLWAISSHVKCARWIKVVLVSMEVLMGEIGSTWTEQFEMAVNHGKSGVPSYFLQFINPARLHSICSFCKSLRPIEIPTCAKRIFNGYSCDSFADIIVQNVSHVRRNNILSVGPMSAPIWIWSNLHQTVVCKWLKDFSAALRSTGEADACSIENSEWGNRHLHLNPLKQEQTRSNEVNSGNVLIWYEIGPENCWWQ
jgi:hypothetical protein